MTRTASEQPDPLAHSDVLRVPLKALGLRAGMALQTRRLVDGAAKVEAQFFGAIEGKGVMVGPSGSQATRTGLEPGNVCVVRGFTGQFEFSFVSKVLQTFENPFAYALLAYPADVSAQKVRCSLRTKVSWPATVTPKGAAQPAPVTLVDLSPEGAMVRSPNPLGAVGETIHLALEGRMDASALTLYLSATLCHHNRPPGEGEFIAGMAFKELSQHDKLALHFLASTAANTPEASG